jgi:(methylthio)acryloyl-CoA hydratase
MTDSVPAPALSWPPAGSAPFADYPGLLAAHWHGHVAVISLARPSKRNAMNDPLVLALKTTFETLPTTTVAAVIHGQGDHFCAGLDLSELQERDAVEGLHHSRMWHTALNAIEYGRVPVVAALHGAVVGGGIELASACHIRVADDTAFFALPEGTRGIFVGGGGSVRIPRLIGASRMADMMFTGRVYNATDAERLGLCHYQVPQGGALARAIELAERIGQNAPMTNYALMHALPRIADQTADHGLFTESLVAAITENAPVAKERIRAFLEGRAAKVRSN